MCTPVSRPVCQVYLLPSMVEVFRARGLPLANELLEQQATPQEGQRDQLPEDNAIAAVDDKMLIEDRSLTGGSETAATEESAVLLGSAAGGGGAEAAEAAGSIVPIAASRQREGGKPGGGGGGAAARLSAELEASGRVVEIRMESFKV